MTKDQLTATVLVTLGTFSDERIAHWDETEYYYNRSTWGRYRWDTEQLAESIADRFSLWTESGERTASGRSVAEYPATLEDIIIACRDFCYTLNWEKFSAAIAGLSWED